MTDSTNEVSAVWKGLMKKKLDSMFNASTGLGGPNDKSNQTVWTYEPPDPYTLDAMHAEDTVSARIVEVPPRDAMSKGFEIKSPKPIKWRQDVSGDAFESWLAHNQVKRHIQYAAALARLHGGSGIVLFIDDGRMPDQPVDFENIKRVTLTRARDRWELTPIDWFDDFADPRYGTPKIYQLNPRSYGGATKYAPTRVHADRLLRFDGFELSPESYARNLWWGGSVLWRARKRVERFIASEQALAILLQEAKEDVLYLKNLEAILTNKDGKGNLESRAVDLALMRGLTGTTFIDADDKYESRMRPLNGVSDVHDRFMLSVAQAAEMPVTLIFGDAARGLSADDKAGRTYYNSVLESIRADQYQPALEQLIKLAFYSKSGPTDGKPHNGWTIEWPAYEKLDPLQDAQRQKTEAEADKLNIESGVYTPEEARESRYVSGSAGRVIIELDEPEEEPEESLTPAIDPIEGAAGAPVKEVQKAALNGAQVKSLLEVARLVNLGEISPGQAMAVVRASFPVGEDVVRAISEVDKSAINVPTEDGLSTPDYFPGPAQREELDHINQLANDNRFALETVVKNDELLTVPEPARNNARQVLKWREEHGDEVKGMTRVGWTRATQLANEGKVSREVASRMAQFNRHRKNAKVSEEFKDEPWKDAGYVAWLGWGGDTGIGWAMGLPDDKQDEYEGWIMVAYQPPQSVTDAIKSTGGFDVDDLHMTLVYSEIDADDVDAFVDAVERASVDMSPLPMRYNGPAIFKNDKVCLVTLWSSVGLAEQRTAMKNAIEEDSLLGDQEHDFIPHMTLDYYDGSVPADDLASAFNMTLPDWTAGKVVVNYEGNEIASFNLGESMKMDPYTSISDPRLPKNVQAMSDEDKQKWISVFNKSIKEQPEDEGRAFAMANASVK